MEITQVKTEAMNDRYIIGVDLGGTSINVGVLPFDGGSILGMRSMPTESQHGAKFVVDRMIDMIRSAMKDASREANIPDDGFIGIGLGSPGPLDRKTGTVIETPNLGWRNFPVRDLVSNAIGLEAELDNDANCATLGEWWQGAGRGVRMLVGVTLGTGIGGGIVIDGRVFHGVADVAGEVGHMTIDSTGRKCNCGNYGCLEAYASGPAIAARAIEEVMRDTAKFLGTGIANLMNILNPEMVVISGGVTRAGEHLFEPLRTEVRRRAFQHAEETCTIVSSQLGGMAGVIGAAYNFRVERFGNG
jgi:glucokinase